MIDRGFAALIAGLCLVVSALPGGADEGTPESEEGRYTFHKIADGFVRLDMQTGEVSTCSQRTVPAGTMPEAPVAREDHRGLHPRGLRSGPHGSLHGLGLAAAGRGDHPGAKTSPEQRLAHGVS
jgi:hypothetical protein